MFRFSGCKSESKKKEAKLKKIKKKKNLLNVIKVTNH